MVARPLLHVGLRHDRELVGARALVDAGADFSYLPSRVGALLGVIPAVHGASEHWIAGIAGGCQVCVVELEVNVIDPVEPKHLLVPFLVPTGPDERMVGGRLVRPPLVIGRHPFFTHFRICVDAAASQGPRAPSWTLEATAS
jgi:hypothetical protein